MERNAVTAFIVTKCNDCGAQTPITRAKILNIMCGLSENELEHNRIIKQHAAFDSVQKWNHRVEARKENTST